MKNPANTNPAKKFASLLLVSLLLNMCLLPSFAELPSAAETPSGLPSALPKAVEMPNAIALFEEGEDSRPELVEEPKTLEFSCSTPDTNPKENVLLPKEVQKLKQKTEVENKGFNIDRIDSGRGPNTERDKLENSIVVQETEDGSSIATELPAEKIDVGEVSPWFNKYYSGPFAFGVSLDDTIRLGQCRNLSRLEETERGCPVAEEQLLFRNSGEGIGSNFVRVWDDVKDIFSGEDKGQFTAEQAQDLQFRISAETDMNKLEAKTVKRNTELIQNSVKTEDFIASMATTGDDSTSLISLYSMFDKYFNSWFSTEMVVSTFGPTLVGSAKKYAGWMTRRGWPWSISDSKFMNYFRRKFTGANSLYGQARLQRMVTRTDKYGFGDAWTKGIEATGNWDSGYAFVKGGSFRKTMNDWSKAGGYLDEMKDPITRGEFFKQIRDLRGVGHTNKAIYDHSKGLFDDAVRKFGANSPEARAALMDLGKTNADLMLNVDAKFLKLDASELWVKERSTGLSDIAVKQKGVDQFIPLSDDSRHIARIQRDFIEDKWADPSFAYETTGNALNFYKVSPTGEFLGDVHVEDLSKNLSRYSDKAAVLETGEVIHIDSASLPYIARESGTGNVKVYKANWEAVDPETPLNYAKRLTSARGDRVTSNLPNNMDRLYNTLVEKNFGGQSRHYYNILDKAFSQEQEILKSYFSIKGGAKWTLLPFLYWQGKRGFGFEGLSAFQLPDSWKEVELYTEEEEIFDDAFMDVFAQHGSDEGEIFSQVLNKLPWKMVLNYVSNEFSPDSVDNAYDSWTNPLSGWRRKVENVAYFTSTREDCSTCGVTLLPKVSSQSELVELVERGRGEAVFAFSAEQDMHTYFLEDILNDDAREEGTTLIAYGHHTNIRGQSMESGEPVVKEIDLIEAKKEESRCQDAVKELGLGFLGEKPERAAAILAFGETMGYALFFWSGIIGSVIQQTLLVPKLQDCVDDVEGYYLHMYASYDKAKEETETASEKGSKIGGSVIEDIGNLLQGKTAETKEEDKEKQAVDEKGQPYTPKDKNLDQKDKTTFNRANEPEKGWWEQKKDEFFGQMAAVGERANAKDILQMKVDTIGETLGLAFFGKMFFFWFKGNTQPAIYDDKSKSALEDNDKKVSVIVDKEKGEISVKKEGEPAETVITSKDHSRMSGPDTRPPAYAVPQRIGRIGLPSGPAVELFKMGWAGDFHVMPQTVLDCIKQNVEAQTGVALAPNDITHAFGDVEHIVTDSYPSIEWSRTEKTIIANGAPRLIVHGDDAMATVMSDLKTVLSNGEVLPAGNFKSVQFKNGVILLKPALEGKPAELLIWIRYHDKSVLRASQVKGLKAKLADPIINPETDCPEPAIDLSALPNLEAGEKSVITQAVGNFNQSIKKMGPFQIFDTARHRFVFYSEKTSPDCNPSQPGCCQDRVSIIDKKTGEVYDQPIVGGLQQTPEGIKFKTADGKEHNLEFSADNGIPKLAYNDFAPETLTMARGPNGAFWYDPDDELWRPYNAQLLPMLEEFKTRGVDVRVREDGTTSAMPGSNTMNVQIGGGAETPFNLPGMPLHPMALLLFTVSLLAAICVARLEIEKRLAKTKE